MITKQQVLDAQQTWGSGVVKIGSLRDNRSECEEYTSDFLDKLYAFDSSDVLFKPTKCAAQDLKGKVMGYFKCHKFEKYV